jgi:glutamyl-Q tRNA(Asp) synthetase
VASYLDARAHRGRWILRIEDLDRPREVAGSATSILSTLESFGFEWHGEVVRQFERRELYQEALHALETRGLTFACSCSRSQLEDELRYPGTCRSRAAPADAATATRLQIAPGQIMFSDRIQGTYRQDVSAAVGDIILKRRDQIFAYVLAVVVDDAAQGVTNIVRGADLLDNTPRQIHLQRLLGLPQPSYAHVPVLTESNDSKLAKTRRSVNLGAAPPLPQLLAVFSLLGLEPPIGLRKAHLRTAWEWAFGQWDLDRVPKRLSLRVND